MYRPRLLIADDDAEWRNLLCLSLRDKRYRLFTCANGREVLPKAERHRPDCLILDFDLGDTNAARVCADLRSKPHLERLPVVILSSHTEEKIRSYRQCGADHFVPKSGNLEELHAVVESTLRRVERDRGILRRGDLRLDPADGSVFHSGKLAAQLSRDQFLFLYMLVSKSPAFVGSPEISRVVLRKPHDNTDAIRQLAHRLRQKLGPGLDRRVRNSKRLGWVYMPPDGGPKASAAS